MKTILKFLTFSGILALFVISCQKEVSFEAGNTVRSDGVLQSDVTGSCTGITVGGVYQKDTVLKTTNYVDVTVIVNAAGSYTISTDTLNGYYFRATGTFTATGSQVVRLQGTGKPLSTGTNDFTVTYDSTICEFSVVVTGAGSGASVFTLNGAPGNCTGATVNGTYQAGVALNASNTVVINVNVTSIGTYNITTTSVNGMTFSAAGTFTSTGAQSITLNGSGTPTAAGTNNIPVTAGASTCQFSVTVTSGGSAAVYTFNGAPGNCAGATVNGTYSAGTALNASNTVVLNVNVTTIGTWSHTTTATNGMVFSGSGTFTTTGAQTITLTGSGTPVAAGTSNIPITSGASTCTFSVTVNAAIVDYFPRTTGSNWSYQFDGDPNDSAFVRVTPQTYTTGGNTYNIFQWTDDASTGYDSSGYYRKSGNDYFEWIDMGDYLGYDNSFWLEYNFLKDNLAAGGTWTTTSFTGPVQGTPITARFKYTILQKDVSITVLSVSYPNTIVVQEKLEVFDGANWIDVSAQTGFFINYYSRNVGLIKQDYDDGAGTIFPLDMRRYQVF